MENIWRDLAEIRRKGLPALLATVVRTFGPAYRRAGAGAVLTAEGVAAGAISGGCLESDLLEAARQVLAGTGARLMDYDSSLDEDLIWGTGTGCGGRVHVLLAEVADPVLDLLLGETEAGRPAALATVVGGPGLGLRLAVTIDGRMAGSLGQPAMDGQAAGVSRGAINSGQREPSIWRFGPDGTILDSGSPPGAQPELPSGAVEVFVQPVWPPPALLILGAGDDAVPLSRLALQVGFQVTVADHRPAYATAQRFPGARLVLGQPEELPHQVELGADTYAVLMTHNYQRDHRLLQVLLTHPVAYVGLLGARERSRRLIQAVRDEAGDRLDRTAWERLYTPVGLDIGADGPAEIAVSVLAEALAVRSGRSGAHMRATRPVG